MSRPVRSPRRPGARVLGAAALVLVPLALAGCTSTSVLDLKVGDCLQLPSESSAATIERAKCTDSHEAEVSALVTTDPKDAKASYPGADALSQQAETGCVDSFEGYVGTPYVSSGLDVTWLTPTEQSWSEGDRTIVCLVHAMDAQELTTSVKDSKL